MKKTPPKSGKTQKINTILPQLSLAVFVLAVVLNINTLSNEYAFDDASVITENFLVKRGFDGLGDILSTSYRYGYWNQPGTLYRPFSLLMFAVEYQLFDGKAWFGHLMNVLMYAISAFLLFKVLTRIFKEHSALLLFIITLLYVVHPIHTEVVANIKSRDELGAFLFSLAAIHYFLNYLDKQNRSSLLLSLLLFFIGFMFKENVITFLAVFPLIQYYREESSYKGLIKNIIPFLLPTFLYMAIRWIVLQDLNTIASLSILENVLAGAESTLVFYATAIVLMGKYLLMSIFPWPLSADYSYPEIGLYQPTDFYFILSLLIHLGLIAYTIIGLKKKHPEAFGLAFYFITISIVSNLFITIGASFGERFLYVPVLGILIAFIFLLQRFRVLIMPETTSKNLLQSFISKNKPVAGILMLVLLLASFTTIERNSDWKDDYTLYGSDVLTCPNSTRLHHFYGLELIQEKRRNAPNDTEKQMFLDSAINEFNRALQLYDKYSDTYERLAYAMVLKGNTAEGIANYEKALVLNPTNAVAINNMGQIYFDKKDYRKAEELYRKAISLDAKFADAYFNLGSTLGTLGDFPASIANFQKAIEFDPENAKAYYFLGISLSNMNRIQEAQSYFDKAGRLDPTLKRNN